MSFTIPPEFELPSLPLLQEVVEKLDLTNEDAFETIRDFQALPYCTNKYGLHYKDLVSDGRFHLATSVRNIIKEIFPRLPYEQASTLHELLVNETTISQLSLRYDLGPKLYGKQVYIDEGSQLSPDLFEAYISGLLWCFRDVRYDPTKGKNAIAALQDVYDWLKKVFRPLTVSGFEFLFARDPEPSTPDTESVGKSNALVKACQDVFGREPVFICNQIEGKTRWRVDCFLIGENGGKWEVHAIGEEENSTKDIAAWQLRLQLGI